MKIKKVSLNLDTPLVKLASPYAIKNALKQPIIHKMSFHFPGRKQSCNRLYCIKHMRAERIKKILKMHMEHVETYEIE